MTSFIVFLRIYNVKLAITFKSEILNQHEPNSDSMGIDPTNSLDEFVNLEDSIIRSKIMIL